MRGDSFQAKWEQFLRLKHTSDSLENERRGLRRWKLLPHIAFVIPIEDVAVRDQLRTWEDTFAQHMPYLPQPIDRAHITLHYVGRLRTSPWMLLPHTWQRPGVEWLAKRARGPLQACPPFEIAIGPLNAFANVLFAEVQDTHKCLRATRLALQRALPMRARPPSRWDYLPHITLGFWGQQAAPPLAQLVRAFRDIEPVPLRVESVKFTLYWRDIVPATPDLLARAREEVIAEYPLLGR